MVFPPWMKKQETDTSATPEQDVSTPKTTVQEENTARLWQHEQRITALELIIEDIRDKVLRKIQQPKRRY
jgi:TolA-binding protein